MHATVTASQIAAVTAVGSITEAMKVANKQMDVQKTMKIMAEFQRENERTQVKEEMMDDALMDAFDTEGAEEEADLVTNQILAELGVELDQQMVGLNAPAKRLQTEEDDVLDEVLPDLKARLDAL